MERLFPRALIVAGLVPVATGIYGVATGAGGIPGGDGTSVNVESELRFAYALWVAYGVAVVYVGLRAWRSRAAVGALAAVLFATGVARAVAWAAAGRPDAEFLALLALELVLPPVMVGWQRLALRTAAPPD